MKITTTRPGFYVVCDDFTAGPFRDRAAAERKLAAIERVGACGHPHRIEDRT